MERNQNVFPKLTPTTTETKYAKKTLERTAYWKIIYLEHYLLTQGFPNLFLLWHPWNCHLRNRMVTALNIDYKSQRWIFGTYELYRKYKNILT